MYKLIAIRTQPSDDLSHDHIELVGYESPHMPGEPIMIPVARIPQRKALGETFWLELDGEKLDVDLGPCPLCGFEPHIKTSTDDAGTPTKLFSLPRS